MAAKKPNRLKRVGVIFDEQKKTFYVELHNAEGQRWGVYKTRDKKKAIKIAERLKRFSDLELVVLGEVWV